MSPNLKKELTGRMEIIAMGPDCFCDVLPVVLLVLGTTLFLMKVTGCLKMETRLVKMICCSLKVDPGYLLLLL